MLQDVHCLEISYEPVYLSAHQKALVWKNWKFPVGITTGTSFARQSSQVSIISDGWQLLKLMGNSIPFVAANHLFPLFSLIGVMKIAFLRNTES